MPSNHGRGHGRSSLSFVLLGPADFRRRRCATFQRFRETCRCAAVGVPILRPRHQFPQ
ncbi:hypothetical protein FRUB_09583 [Fimbriiglobus ruber]|uniref:Uncharacterized protein n=1 Tax=Fimbriiglobus ruber TaxID=1908690 RepID=A0A225CZG9_9BACT|nr:hypothetical protein FRUB_09583 [Fimbriiglobus ruber]